MVAAVPIAEILAILTETRAWLPDYDRGNYPALRGAKLGSLEEVLEQVDGMIERLKQGSEQS